jgi:3-hydroxyisobutyrate dehydrogenase
MMPPDMTPLNVALIGTGIMGSPMALNITKAGFPLTVHSRTKSKAKPALDAGATWSNSPKAAAQNADVIITILPDTPDVEAAYFGESGLLESLNPGAVAIDMSTVSPDIARRISAKATSLNAEFLDAPVSGGKTGAQAATLAIMVGGNPEALDRARPVLEAVGQTIVHCGPSGAGQLTKLCNQIIVAGNLLAVAEGVHFAKRVGLNPKTTLDVISKGAAASWALENLGHRMLNRDFDPMFMIDLQQKDLRLALDQAYANAAPLPGASLVHQLLTSNQSANEGKQGTQALLKTLERLTNQSQ